MWWRDEPVVKVTKEVVKCVPPEPVWLRPDYLPGLEEALKFDIHVMTDAELAQARLRRDKLLFDIEIYWNYFLIGFRSYTTGDIVYFEMTPEHPLDDYELQKLEWIMRNFTLVGFNSYGFDLPLAAMAIAGKTCEQIKTAANRIILEDWRPADVLKQFKTARLKNIDHIDLIEVAPLQASLKIYGGRLHAPRMQDLPFHPETHLTPQQMAIVRWYNVNDLTQTGFLMESLREQLELREAMGMDYGVDLRSKSDAQMAEAIISQELWRLSGDRPGKPTIQPGTSYKYKVPEFVKFSSPLMNWALDVIRNEWFIVAHHGSIDMPPAIASLRLQIGSNTYQMGMGGLHSSETTSAFVADNENVIVDRDVSSYYPEIIRKLGLYPQHLGPLFLRVYSSIVDRRLAAKAAKMMAQSEGLKIAANGSFGKLGNKYSIFYAPDLLIQVTLTGQLALLMLIERATLLGFHVINANTDGVVILCPRARRHELNALVKQWELETGLTTEETEYSAYYTRDVNNYMAVKMPDKKGYIGVKGKGAYANPWNNPTNDRKQAILRLHKNPTNLVCTDAVQELLTRNAPVADTIRACKDVTKFITVRKVGGGAVKDGAYLGASIRWYYATGEADKNIIYAKTGKKVPRSDGAKPLMDLPVELPADVDYDWYIQEARKILQEIGYLKD